MITYSHTHTHSHTHNTHFLSLIQTHKHTQMNIFSHMHILTVTHTNTLILTHTLTHKLTYLLTYTHNTITHSLSFFFSLSLSLYLFLSFSYTHTKWGEKYTFCTNLIPATIIYHVKNCRILYLFRKGRKYLNSCLARNTSMNFVLKDFKNSPTFRFPRPALH